METETVDGAPARLVVVILLALMAVCTAGALALVASGYSWI